MDMRQLLCDQLHRGMPIKDGSGGSAGGGQSGHSVNGKLAIFAQDKREEPRALAGVWMCGEEASRKQCWLVDCLVGWLVGAIDCLMDGRPFRWLL
jgi:hypothetical protein